MGLEFDGVNGIIKNTTSDGDVTIKGNDGGSEISALVFDMSAEGTATFNHDVKLGDDGELVFGAGGDLKIRHDSSNNVSFIEETGSSNFHIRGNQIVLKSQTDNDDFAKFIENGAVELYYSNAKKLETASGGVTVTGTLTTDAANVPQEALTSSSNAVAWDATAKPNAFHVTTENTTFSAPTNNVEGAFIALEINYNGSHTIAFNTVFEFAGSTAPTFTSTDGKTDILVFRYNGAVWQEVGRTLNLSES